MSYDEIYQSAIENGASPMFADMLASRQPPGTKGTERAFMEGRMHNSGIPDSMPRNLRTKLLHEAKQAGVDVSGKVYVSGLARRPNDPYGWCAGRDEVLAKVKANGWSCEGNVTHKPSETPLHKRDRKEKKKHART